MTCAIILTPIEWKVLKPCDGCDINNPEISVTVDREKAMIEGISTGQVGMEIRTAVFGKEVSKLKQGKMSTRSSCATATWYAIISQTS
jgi:hypothetical protein